jgi:tRNA pseudouridine32 synthase/23S rRNA pseudouridine746 synthase
VTESVFELHVEVDTDSKALELLSGHTLISKQGLKQAMKKGCVWVTHGKHTRRLRRADKSLQSGDQLHIYYDESILAAVPAPPVLITDEKDYSVWVKPRGVFSQGSRWGDHCTINRWIETNTSPQRPCFIVHRLDRAATGLMLLAHTKSAAAKLSALFAERDLDKHYRVIVEGEFVALEPVLIDAAIDDKDAKTVINSVNYCARLNRTLLDVKIETGRKHQIRRHLSEAGFPVVGDSLYGLCDNNEDLELAAYSLRFICPLSGEEKYYQLPASYCPRL